MNQITNIAVVFDYTDYLLTVYRLLA